MKLMGKKGKRQIAKQPEKRKATHRTVRAESQSTPTDAPSEQNVTVSEQIATDNIEPSLSQFPVQTHPGVAPEKNSQSNPESAQAEEESSDYIPKLTKTPPPPKYLQPATRVPTSQSAAPETKARQNESKNEKAHTEAQKAVYSRKSQPERIVPLPAEKMPQRDPLAPRSHVTPLRSQPEQRKNVQASEEPVYVPEPEYASDYTPDHATVEDDILDIEQPEPEPITKQELYQNAETKRFTPQNEAEKPAKRKKSEKGARRDKNAKARKNEEQGKEAEKKSKVKENGSTGSKVALVLIILFVVVGAALFGFYYWWTTHAGFEYSMQAVVIVEGADVNPADFLYRSEGVSVTFRDETFTPEPGRQTVPLTLTYGLRTLDAFAVLYVLSPIRNFAVEFAEDSPDLNPIDMLSNAEIARGVPFDLSFQTMPLPLAQYSIGEHILNLELNGTPFSVRLNVADTTPPTATPVSMSILIGEEVSAEDFVTDVRDASQIMSIEFLNEPDVFSGRNQIIEIEITDEFGNIYVVASALSVAVNVEPPRIEGTETIHSRVGNPIIYRAGVIAFDDFGRELEFHVDTSGVDQHTVGTYTAIYWVEDFTGNRTEVEVTVFVVDIDPEYVDTRVDEIIEGILTDDMTQVQQAREIMRWVRSNVRVDTDIRGGPDSVYEGAYRALRERRGNCYIFFSISERLLTRAGIPNMRISRTPGLSATNHHWSLINPDGLGWHHFDSMPTRFYWSPQMYMFTQSQAERFAADLAPLHGGPHFYTFDPDLFPPIVP
ncbi:MAG: hypothetical protein FWC20_04160 [Oscillospiraceae bacterium]|nr:hypothetical protein [Oscillospiraceae bacterium]MCL2278586.1 hypothetical protein [Oscillospiraceae bacterium]